MECCKEENFEVVEQREDITVKCCQVCGRRHFELLLKPGFIPWTTT